MDLKRQKVNVLGVGVDDISTESAINSVLRLAEAKKRENYVVTVNAEFIMKARREPEFMRILNNADLAVADGWWVAFSKLNLGGTAQDRITGVDLVQKLCIKIADRPIRVGFLGGFGSVAGEVAKRQKLASPRLKVVYSEAGDDTISHNSRLKVPKSLDQRVDILFVALGMGKQEEWIETWKKRLDVGVFIGVGGAFDYLAGVKKRAPLALQQAGLEWLWRLALEPGRLWRMRVLPVFFVLVGVQILQQKFFQKKS